MTPKQKTDIIKEASQLRSTLRELESFLNSADEAGVLDKVDYFVEPNIIGDARGSGMSVREAIIEADGQSKQLLWETMQLTREVKV